MYMGIIIYIYIYSIDIKKNQCVFIQLPYIVMSRLIIISFCVCSNQLIDILSLFMFLFS